MSLVLGCIGDDFTGSSDLANTLVKQGMRTVQLIGVPKEDQTLPEQADAVVVALKSRTIAARDAVEQSVAALRWLEAHGARQFFFKYCSTFDSTEDGNIGPVAEALLKALGADFTIACPAFPTNHRTVYRGHLFVGDALLNESGMENHPLNPMTDANLVRVLGRQSEGQVGLVPYERVRAGAGEIRAAFAELRQAGYRHAIVDAITDAHLVAIGHACDDLALVTGGSGVALGLPDNYRARGWIDHAADAAGLSPAGGPSAVVAGSCSRATLAQIEVARKAGYPAFRIDPLKLAAGTDQVDEALAWALPQLGEMPPVLVYASAPPEQVQDIQSRLGREKAGVLVEDALARVARGLVEAGVRRLVVAGGETAGAVVNALGIDALRIGKEIDPGVPWTVGTGRHELFLALKSGNFGAPDFFIKAFAM